MVRQYSRFLVFMGLFFLGTGVSFCHLPDSGQYISYSTATGDDGYYQGSIQPFFTIIPSTAGTMVLDNNTELIWVSTAVAYASNWENSIIYCENLNFGGFTDWRLPNVREAFSLFDYGRWPGLNNAYFYVNGQNYWTSTTYSGSSSQAFYFWDYSGSFPVNPKTNGFWARCVRGPDSIASEVPDVNIVSISSTALMGVNPAEGYTSMVSFVFGVVLFGLFLFGLRFGRSS